MAKENECDGKGDFSDSKIQGNNNESEGKSIGEGKSRKSNVRFGAVENDRHRYAEISPGGIRAFLTKIALILPIAKFEFRKKRCVEMDGPLIPLGILKRTIGRALSALVLMGLFVIITGCVNI